MGRVAMMKCASLASALVVLATLAVAAMDAVFDKEKKNIPKPEFHAMKHEAPVVKGMFGLMDKYDLHHAKMVVAKRHEKKQELKVNTELTAARDGEALAREKATEALHKVDADAMKAEETADGVPAAEVKREYAKETAKPNNPFGVPGDGKCAGVAKLAPPQMASAYQSLCNRCAGLGAAYANDGQCKQAVPLLAKLKKAEAKASKKKGTV